jgi:uncharacterized protein YneF (UPF0154 family)
MKKIYLILFTIAIIIFLLIGLYFVKIPSPSKLISEEYKLIVE